MKSVVSVLIRWKLVKDVDKVGRSLQKIDHTELIRKLNHGFLMTLGYPFQASLMMTQTHTIKTSFTGTPE